MAGVEIFSGANLFNIDKVSISLTDQEFKDPSVIKISRNGSQYVLEYRAVKATVSEQEASKLHSQLGIRID